MINKSVAAAAAKSLQSVEDPINQEEDSAMQSWTKNMNRMFSEENS